MTKRVKSAAAASRLKAGLPFALTRGGHFAGFARH
jgi:hypothetical protein